jgi:putative SOS response-associated peptidase YedK
MCGRFHVSTSASQIAAAMRTKNASPNTRPRYNVAPTDPLPVVVFDHETKTRRFEVFRWGLIPYWAKDAKIGYSSINAAAETVAEKPAFREPFQSRRCIVPTDGFYEWQKLGPKEKQPYHIVMKDRSLFGFAGLWDRWKDRASGEVIRSFTIITTTPNEVCAPIHDRMPVILDPKDYGRWLGEESAEPVHLLAMLKPYPAEAMTAYPVSPRVGNVKNDDATLIEPTNELAL